MAYINPDNPVYFTYARSSSDRSEWEHIDDIVPDLLKTFREDNIKYSVDVEDIKNGAVISDYEKEIGNAQYVIVVLSDRYFFRYHCMFELSNILKNTSGKTIKFIKVGNFNINNIEYKAKIKEFWRTEKARIDNKIETYKHPDISELEQAAIDNNYYLDFIDNLSKLFRSVSYTNAEKIRLSVFGNNNPHKKFVTEIKKDLGWTPLPPQPPEKNPEPKPPFNDKYILYALIAVLFGLVIWLSVRNPNSGTKHDDINIVDTEDNPVIPIVINGVTYGNMIRVPGGTFQMGATSEQGSDAYDNEKPVHQVTLSDFYIGETEVTQGLWKAVMGDNPSATDRGIGDNYPVNMVSWKDIVNDFLPKLNQLTGKTFRLPTEAEWEYAARGGKSGGTKYSGSNNVNDVTWYRDNADKKTHPVKTKNANSLGLYDMSGNVWEWCQDLYGDYSSVSVINPQGSALSSIRTAVEWKYSGASRVLRGGSWDNNTDYCRVSYRDDGAPNCCSNRGGFRLLLSSQKK